MPAPRFHPFTRLVFCALGIFAVSVALGLLLLVGSALSTAWTGRAPAEQLLDLATRFALPLTVLSYPASLGWLAICRVKFDGRSFVSLGFRPRRAMPDFGRGALVGTLSIGLLAAILVLTGAISVEGWSSETLEMGLGRSILALLGYATLFFAVGFFEETVFRGYALHNLFSWLGWRGAVASQAILFAIVHLGNVGGSNSARLAAFGALPSLFLIAVFFALCYRKTGSLWFPIGFHFAWNFCLGCVFSLPVSGITTFRLFNVSENSNNWLSGGEFGAEGSFLLIPILIALLVYISRAPDHPQALLDLELINRTEAAPAPVMEIPAPEPEEEPRENRYGTKFGTSQGFSADTLRELRELQEAREKGQAEARDAVRREALSQLSTTEVASETPILAPLSTTQTTVQSATQDAEISPLIEAEASTPKPATQIEVSTEAIPETVVQSSETEALTPEEAPIATAPAATTPTKPKAPAPRW